MTMASPTSSSHNGGENGGQLLQDLELLSKALYPRKGERKKTLHGRWSSLPSSEGQANKILGRNAILNNRLSNIGFRHSTSSAILDHFEQGEKWDIRLRLSPTRGWHVGKSNDFDEKSARRGTDLHSFPNLQHSCSCVEGKNILSIDSFPEWLEDNLNFSKKMEAPIDKKSLWNWKPLRSLAHVWQQRFSCIFSLQVHCIKGLPQSMDGLQVSVHWRRRGVGEQTMPARVCKGVADFEETLHRNCTIYGSKSPDQGMCYESKIFTLYVTVLNAEGVDFGKHQLDLSRLLPETIGNSREGVKCGSWTTSFKLKGEGRGGALIVTLWYEILNKELRQMGQKRNSDVEIPDRLSKQSFGRLSNSAHGTPRFRPLEAPISPSVSEPGGGLCYVSQLALDDPASSVVDEIPCKTNTCFQQSKGMRSRSLASLYDFKPEFKIFPQSDAMAEFNNVSCQALWKYEEEESRLEDLIDVTVVEKGVEMDNGNVLQLLQSNFSQEGSKENGSKPGDDKGKSEEGINDSLAWQSDAFHLLPEENVVAEEPQGSLQNHQERNGNLGKTCNTEDEVDLVEGEFLSMLEVDRNFMGLSSDSDPDSPRASLLSQFERESLLEGSSVGLEFIIPSVPSFTQASRPSWDSDEDLGLASIVQAGELELQKVAQTMRSKTRAKMLEDAETETLMQKWGLSEKAFQTSPPNTLGGFGSPINVPLLKPVEQPALAEGLGSVVKMKHGGLLRSISPQIFQNCKIKGSLIMQVSKPLALPAEMGSNIMDIFHSLTSLGTENFSMQARTMMPLEDIAGKSIQQVVLEEGPIAEGSKKRQSYIRDWELDTGSECGFSQLSSGRRVGVSECNSQVRNHPQGLEMSCAGDSYEEYVSLEEVVLLAMEKIEALLIEGLKIQSDMSDQDAPSNVSAMLAGEMPDLESIGKRKSGSLGLEGTTSLQSLDKENNGTVDGLMALFITLDDWMQLFARIVDQEEVSERMSKVIGTPHAAHSDLIGRVHHEGGKGNRGSRKHGIEQQHILGNALTMALLVQLHDPLRNYEPVGAPMMTLVQVECVVLPPNPKMEGTVSEKGNSEAVEEVKDRKNQLIRFKITDVHVAGLKFQKDNKAKSWSNQKQQQSGSRWLIANGMANSGKHTLQKLKTRAKSIPPSKTKVKTGETLWSISACVHGSGGNWKEVGVLNPPVRNHDIIIPDETIMLR